MRKDRKRPSAFVIRIADPAQVEQAGPVTIPDVHPRIRVVRSNGGEKTAGNERVELLEMPA